MAEKTTFQKWLREHNMGKFTPNWMVYSVLGITPTQLKQQQIYGVLLDIDNTLLSWTTDVMKPDVQEWVQRLVDSDVKVVFISNNVEQRVKMFADQFGVAYVFSAKKPFKNGFLKAIALLQLPKENIVVIGDQLFTDVFGGNRQNLRTIMVKSVGEKDMWPTAIARRVEKLVLAYHRLTKKLDWREVIES